MISYLLLFCDETLTKITRPGKTPFPPSKERNSFETKITRIIPIKRT